MTGQDNLFNVITLLCIAVFSVEIVAASLGKDLASHSLMVASLFYLVARRHNMLHSYMRVDYLALLISH